MQKGRKIQILQKIFSPKGELNRIEYLIYGLIVSNTIFAISIIIHGQIANNIAKTFSVICVVITVYVALNTAIKRANNTALNTLLILVMLFFLTPIAILYLLFTPAKAVDSSNKQKKQLGIIGVIGIIFISILGIVSSVVNPKLVKFYNSQKVKQQTQSTPVTNSINQ